MKPLPLLNAVIHVASDKQALDQACLAFDNGAQGIFLIDHGRSHEELIQSYCHVRACFHEKFIGINFLDLGPLRALGLVPGCADALWMDQDASGDTLFRETYKMRPIRPHVLMGAAFKYRPRRAAPEDEARAVADAGYVPCTSGPGTGQAASPEKVSRMKEALGSRPLALASGVTPENVHTFLPHVDCILVASGVSIDEHTLDPTRLRRLANTVQVWKATNRHYSQEP